MKIRNISSLNNFLEKIKIKFNNITYSELINIFLSLFSCNRTQNDAFTLLNNLSKKNILENIYKENIKSLSNIINPNLKTIATYETMHFGGQLTYISKRINKDKRYNFISLVDKNIIEKNNSIDRIMEFFELPILFIPNQKVLKKYTFIDAVILNEGYSFKTSLPKNVIRIMQPHGLDIPTQNTVIYYGGGTIANYILAPMQEERKIDNIYKDKFPRKMIEHLDNILCIIPSGYTKLDQFIEEYNKKQKSKKAKIILHFSHIGFHSKEACDDLGKTLKLLLDSFPEHQIVFRPYPTQKDNPIIINALNNVKEHKRLQFSINSSYIEDYVDADFLVSYRIQTAQTFAYATGNPIIFFPIEENKDLIEEHPLGYLVYTHEQLINQGKYILVNKNKEQERILNYRNKLLNNPGTAVNYFIKHLPYILEKKKHPKWQYLELYDKNKEVNYEQEYMDILKKGNIQENIARSAVDNYPKNYMFKYFLVLALLNTPASENSHYYFRWYEAIDITKDIFLNSKNKEVKNLLCQLFIDEALKKSYQLHNYINITAKPFDVLMSSTLNLRDFNRYIKDYTNNYKNNLETIHNSIINTYPTLANIKLFFINNKDKKIIIWGAGEILNKIIPSIPYKYYIRIVDKNLYNKTILLYGQNIKIEKDTSINAFNPDIILIASNKYYEEIQNEIKRIYLHHVKIIPISQFYKLNKEKNASSDNINTYL